EVFNRHVFATNGSGQRATMEVVMRAKGWTKADFLLAEELPAAQQSLALCHGRVQAMVYTVGHPNASIGQAAGLCDAIVVDVTGPEIDKLVADNPYYAHTTIPGGMYSGNPNPVRTFGVKATVITSREVPADLIYGLTKAVFDNLAQLRKMHPAFAGLEPKKMIGEGLSAPLHDGAARYFKEKGLK
ncbi:MAG: TAXI family TRAP transporter solute-binding subunit, partial [Acidiferrobacterales bacterium]